MTLKKKGNELNISSSNQNLIEQRKNNNSVAVSNINLNILNKNLSKQSSISTIKKGISMSKDRTLIENLKVNKKGSAISFKEKEMLNDSKTLKDIIEKVNNDDGYSTKLDDSMYSVFENDNLYKKDSNKISKILKNYYEIKNEYPKTCLEFYKVGKVSF